MTSGVGFTITFTIEMLVQLPAVAAMKNVVVCWVLVVLVSIPEMGVPPPNSGIPVRLAVFVRDQLNNVPATPFGLKMSIGVIGEPEQIV